MILNGKNTRLRPALPSDREKIFLWLTKSDLTPSFIGKPDFPDSPIPSWEEFIRDYTTNFFSPSGNKKGRNFIILSERIEVGTVGYDLFNQEKNTVALDIWLRSKKYCGRNYGVDALQTLCIHLSQKYRIKNFYISPSLRNIRAISCYKKAGFTTMKMDQYQAKQKFGVDVFDYDDNVVMKKFISYHGMQPTPPTPRRG